MGAEGEELMKVITRMFSRAAFEVNAARAIKRLLPVSHREALDGLEVAFSEEELGSVDYEADGRSWYLYPVYREWCKDCETCWYSSGKITSVVSDPCLGCTNHHNWTPREDESND